MPEASENSLTPDPAAVKTHGGLRLHQTDIIFKDQRISKTQTQVGEITFVKP